MVQALSENSRTPQFCAALTRLREQRFVTIELHRCIQCNMDTSTDLRLKSVERILLRAREPVFVRDSSLKRGRSTILGGYRT